MQLFFIIVRLVYLEHSNCFSAYSTTAPLYGGWLPGEKQREKGGEARGRRKTGSNLMITFMLKSCYYM